MILTLRASVFQVLLIERGEPPFQGSWALPGGFLRDAEEDIYDAALRELYEETGLEAGNLHMEQLAAYGTPGRDPRRRIVSVAYLTIAPELPEPVAGTDAASAFWTPVEQVLDHQVSLAFDHHDIVSDAVERARDKLERTPLATAFVGKSFTITDLQRVYEAVWGVSLDPRNFYRKVQGATGFIVPAGSERRTTAGRPARLYRAGTARTLHPPLTRPTPSAAPEEAR
ncbi:NUDIX hydrolase [Myceligenerans xiligouense]|uniref:NUDIX hydrolase n=1 Tax=Myceligenerans xiligouense TaxID=253184 RepID=UPI001FE26C67|nr:NUDIX domain-containing protein [Myceligenerans xiligouense]